MKGNKFIIMGMAIILLAGMLSPLALGENDSLHVILTVEDRRYSAGDTISVQLRVYNQGAPADIALTDIYLGVSTQHNFNNPTNVSLTKQGTGIFSGSYTVKASDNNRNLYFFYEVTFGNDHEEITSHNDALVIPVYSIQDTVDVSFDGQKVVPAKPGDILTATILTRTGGSPIPITGFTNLYVEAPDGTVVNLTYTTSQTGIYLVEFTAPQVSVSGEYIIMAQPMGMGRDSALVYVNVMDVWYHKISTSGNTISFEVCVADLLGKPIDGANFYIRRAAWPNDEFTGITNASGKALVHVPDVEGSVGFTGFVLAGGLNQTISGAVFNPVAESPNHNGFDIVWEGTETIFRPGKDVSIPYGAYVSRVPAASRFLYYYVTATGTDFDMLFDGGYHVDGAREVLAAGTVTTDSLGKFTLGFKAPDTQCAIHVRIEVPLDPADFPASGDLFDHDDGKYYEAWPQNEWNPEGFRFFAYEGKLDGDGEVAISGGSFRPGKAGTVVVELSAITGDPIIALWGIGEGSLETADTHDPAWMSWVPAGNQLRLDRTESGKYEASFMVPEFIEGEDVTIISGYMDTVDGTPHFDSKTISPGGDIPWLWILIIIIIIVVVVAVIIIAREKMVF
jgi:hypothetical protein